MIRLIHRSLFSLALVVVWFTLAGAQITVYTVQFKTSPIREEAEEEVRQLKAKNVSAYIVKSAVPGKGVFYRVRAGIFTNRYDANRFGANLQQRGVVSEFFVTAYEKPTDEVVSGAPPTSAPKTSVNAQPPQRQERSSRVRRVTTGNLSVNAQQPSFDCTRARTRHEILICNDPYLAQLDAAISDAYWRLRSNMNSEGADALLHAQREFLAERDRQADEEALAKVYEEWQKVLEEIKKALEEIKKDMDVVRRPGPHTNALRLMIESRMREWRQLRRSQNCLTIRERIADFEARANESKARKEAHNARVAAHNASPTDNARAARLEADANAFIAERDRLAREANALAREYAECVRLGLIPR